MELGAKPWLDAEGRENTFKDSTSTNEQKNVECCACGMCNSFVKIGHVGLKNTPSREPDEASLPAGKAISALQHMSRAAHV